MDNKTIDQFLDYVDASSDKAAAAEHLRQRRVDAFLDAQGGFAVASISDLAGKPNILYNGNFEMSCSLDVDPLGWVFEDSFGTVLDYRYQPGNPECLYTPSLSLDEAPEGGTGVAIEDCYYITDSTTYSRNPVRLVYCDWSSKVSGDNSYKEFDGWVTYEDSDGVLQETLSSERNKALEAAGEEIEPYYFAGIDVPYIEGSNKFLMVQDSQKVVETTRYLDKDNSFEEVTVAEGQQLTDNLIPVTTLSVTAGDTSRVSEFSLYQHIPQGVLKAGEKYYITFRAMPANFFSEELTIWPHKVSSMQLTRTPFDSFRWSHRVLGRSDYYGPYMSDNTPFYTFLYNPGNGVPAASVSPSIVFLDENMAKVREVKGESLSMALGAGWYTQVYAFKAPENFACANLKLTCNTNSEYYKGMDFGKINFGTEVQGCSILFDEVGLYPDKPLGKAGAFVTVAQEHRTRAFAGDYSILSTSKFQAESKMYLRGVRLNATVNDTTSDIWADFSIKINGEHVYYPLISQGAYQFTGGAVTQDSSYQVSRGVRRAFASQRTSNTSTLLYSFTPKALYAHRGEVLGEFYVDAGDQIELECVTNAVIPLKVMFDFTKC